MDDNDWDLYAVVRSCSAVSAAAVPDPFSSFVPLPLLEEENREEAKGLEMIGFPYLTAMIGFPYLTATASTTQHELDELCRPFFVKSNQQTKSQQQQEPQPMLAPKYAYAPLPSSSYSSRAASVFPPLAAAPYQLRPQPRPSQRPIAQTPRSKRRKNQQKKVVCQVPADGISTDLWAWRKYGQKPIKGSPYPRGYYRCSSSKGCQARKQVERSLDEPGMLVITYSAEHNHPIPTHRNSLSGSTRQKFPPLNTSAPPPLAEEGEARPLSSPPAAEPRRVQAGEEDEVEEDEGEEEEEVLLTVADVGMLGEDDMLFMGMEVIDGSTMTTISGVNKSPATVSVSSAFFEEEGSFDDDFLRSPNWVGENNMAAANERDSSSS